MFSKFISKCTMSLKLCLFVFCSYIVSSLAWDDSVIKYAQAKLLQQELEEPEIDLAQSLFAPRTSHHYGSIEIDESLIRYGPPEFWVLVLALNGQCKELESDEIAGPAIKSMEEDRIAVWTDPVGSETIRSIASWFTDLLHDPIAKQSIEQITDTAFMILTYEPTRDAYAFPWEELRKTINSEATYAAIIIYNRLWDIEVNPKSRASFETLVSCLIGTCEIPKKYRNPNLKTQASEMQVREPEAKYELDEDSLDNEYHIY